MSQSRAKFVSDFLSDRIRKLTNCLPVGPSKAILSAWALIPQPNALKRPKWQGHFANTGPYVKAAFIKDFRKAKYLFSLAFLLQNWIKWEWWGGGRGGRQWLCLLENRLNKNKETFSISTWLLETTVLGQSCLPGKIISCQAFISVENDLAKLWWCSRSHRLVARVVACGARGTGFDSRSFLVSLLS